MNLAKIIIRLRTVKPDEALLAAQAYVTRLQAGEMRFDAAGLPDELADIESVRIMLWLNHHNSYTERLEGLKTIPPIPLPTLPDNF